MSRFRNMANLKENNKKRAIEKTFFHDLKPNNISFSFDVITKSGISMLH
jgi:hypothetical protein